MEHYRYELHSDCERERVDLWLENHRGLIEIAYAAQGMKGCDYRLTCVHRPLSPAFGVLEVEQLEVRTAGTVFTPIMLDEKGGKDEIRQQG
jgi:hypothetical protein